MDYYNIMSISLQFHEELTKPMWDCLFCGLHLTTKEQNRLHVQQKCTLRPEWDFYCVACGLEYPTKSALKVHMARWCKKLK